ncbi:MAG: sugar phosphate isomerase/epimerase [Kiritimatiellae bacterium]|nr:sugar phosphate isomerase/epimerase [Kiritimatiellia bacterium]
MNKIVFAAVGAALSLSALAGEMKLSLQAYTFRDRSFTETVETAKRLGFTRIESYPGQRLGGGMEGTTDYNSIKPETVRQLKDFMDKSGVQLVSYGVTGAGSDEQWDKLMNFAKALGIELIQIESGHGKAAYDMAENAAKRHNVKVSLHNHTQDGGRPKAVLETLRGRGPMIGAGSDIGHWVRAGEIPLEGVKLLKGKFFCLHFVDVSSKRYGYRDVPLGSGVIDVKAVLDELKAQNFDGFVTVEYEHQSPTLESEVAACARWFKAWQRGEIAVGSRIDSDHISALWTGIAANGKADTWELAEEAKAQIELAKKLESMRLLEIDEPTIKGNKRGYGVEQPPRAFGTNRDHKYCQVWEGKAFVSCGLKTAAAAKVYTVSSSNDNANRDPVEWVLYGSDDGADWKELDHRKDQFFATRYLLKGFEIANPRTCRYYKLEILKHGGDKDMQFSRVGFYADK